jgi:hypothetical protein
MRLGTPSPLVPILALALALALAPAARASLVVVPFAGTITSAFTSAFIPPNSVGLYPYAVGETLVGEFRYGTDAAGAGDFAWASFRTSGGGGSVIQLGTYAFGSLLSIHVRDGGPGEPDTLNLGFSNAAADLTPDYRDVAFTLIDPTGTALAGPGIPTALDPTRFATFRMSYSREVDTSIQSIQLFSADLTAPAAVPEPATLGPALVGLAGLLAAAARGRFRLASIESF